MLNSKEKHKLFVEIGKAIDEDNWSLATELGNELKKHEVNNCRYIKHFSEYEPRPVDNKLSKITATVYRANYKGVPYLVTQKEVSKIRNISMVDAWKVVNNKTTDIIHYEPIGEVLQDTLDAYVEKYHANGNYVTTDRYIDMCIFSEIHVEDLEDLIFDGTADKNGFTYKFIDKEEMN